MVMDRIEINPDVMMGKPVIRGTRIPVALLIRKLGEGATEADLLDAYPRLSLADIRAALAFAADWMAQNPAQARVVMPRQRRRRNRAGRAQSSRRWQ